MSQVKFFELVKRVDEMLCQPPDPKLVSDLRELVRDDALRNYFFEKLTDSRWLNPLLQNGFFSSPPSIRRDPAKGTVQFPSWAESQCLARIAKHAPETVFEIALQIPDTENVRVHDDLAEIALAMPPKMAADFVPRAKEWLKSPYKLLLPEKLGDLISHLAQGGEVKAALDLAGALLAVLPDPRADEKLSGKQAFLASLEPQAQFDLWDYKSILKKNIPDLVAAAENRAFDLLCDLLESAIRLSRRPSEESGREDMSFVWRPAIEDHQQNLDHGLREFLVSTVRNAAEQLVRNKPSHLPTLVRVLEGRPWKVFHRIALHLLRLFSDVAPSLVAERLTDRAFFEDSGLHHEYTVLLGDCFKRLSPEAQAKILSWVEEGPDLESFKKWYQESTGKEASDEIAARYANRWRRDRLSTFHIDLPSGWKEHYQQLTAELGEPEHSEFLAYTGPTWVGPTSPKSAEDIKSMGVEQLVEFLRSWQPSGEWMGHSPEGLGQQVTSVVSSDPVHFAQEATRFEGLDPTYVSGIIGGLEEAAKKERGFVWPPVIDLCRWVVKQPRELPGRRGEYADLDPGWVWTRKAVANLLSVGFESQKAGIPFGLRRQAWEVLRVLTEDPDPTPEHEARYGGSNMDPATLSINTTRGEAMHATVRYALWVRRNIKNAADGEARVKRGFDEIPEVREVLDHHLNPEHEPSLAIRAAYGQWFPWLVQLDAKWASESVRKIFPISKELRKLRDSAWETYVVFCQPYYDTFELLKDEYNRAVDEIGVISSEWRHLADPATRLGEHLMMLYGHGNISLEEPGGILDRFYSNAADELRAHALEFVGRSLRNQKGEISTEILDRFKRLWTKRLEAAQTAPSLAFFEAELSSFGWWFVSERFPDSWALPELLRALKLTGKTKPDHLVIERLAELCSTMPGNAIECLVLIVEGDKEGWGIQGRREYVRKTISTVLQSPDAKARDAAETLVHYLGTRGFWEFRDLLTNRSA